MNAKILLISSLLLLTLALVLFVGIQGGVPESGLFLLLGFLLLVPIFAAALGGTFHPMESIYLWLPLYAYMYLIKPIARFLTAESFSFGEENLDWAIIVSIIGLLTFYMGYYCPLGPRLARKCPLMHGEISEQRLRICAWGFILLGALGLWAYMEQSGGWRQFWSLPHGYGGKVEKTTAYIYQLPELMVVGFFLILYDVLTKKRLRISGFTRVAFASIGGIVIYAVLWSRRTMIAWALITVGTLLTLKKGKRVSLGSVALFWLVLFASITLALAYRPYLHLGVTRQEFAEVEVAGTAAGTISQAGDEYDSFLSIVTLYPTVINYDYFSIYARIFIHPIPRIIWPKKPLLFVSSWEEFLDRSGIGEGASESLLGDLYIQWGLRGILIGMFCLGVLWRFLFAYLQRAPESGFVQLLYAVSLGNVPTVIMQSAISAFWKWMPFMIPSLAIAYRFARKKALGAPQLPQEVVA